MYIVTITSLIAVLFVLLESKQKITFGFGFAFFLVTFVQAIHYNYGNDYMIYLQSFYEYTCNPFNLKHLLNSHRDGLWPIFCYIFKPVGFFGMVAFLTVFQNSVYFYFIKKNVPQQWLVLGVFVYLFTPQLYLLNMSMLRQGFCEALFLCSFLMIQKKERYCLVFAIALVLFAGQIHSSIYALIPFLLLSFFPLLNTKILISVLLILWSVFIVSSSLAGSIVNAFFKISMFGQRYDIYLLVVEKNSSIGLGYVIMSIPAMVIIGSLLNDFGDMKKKVMCMAVFERFVFAFSSIAPLVGRMGFYFSVFYMVAFPLACSKIRDNFLKFMIISSYVAMSLLVYWGFYRDKVYQEYFSDFHSVFEVFLQ